MSPQFFVHSRSVFLVLLAILLLALFLVPSAAGQCLERVGVWGDTGPDDDQVLGPSFKLVATNTAIYSLDQAHGCIEIFSLDGENQGAIGPFPGMPGELSNPLGIPPALSTAPITPFTCWRTTPCSPAWGGSSSVLITATALN